MLPSESLFSRAWTTLLLCLPLLLFGSQVKGYAEGNRRGSPLSPHLPLFSYLSPTRLQTPPGKGLYLLLPASST